MEPTDMLLFLSVLAVGIFIYFVPSFVATSRSHPQENAIIVLNLLLGWTLIGWVVSLTWSVMSFETGRYIVVPLPQTDPANIPEIQEAKLGHNGVYISPIVMSLEDGKVDAEWARRFAQTISAEALGYGYRWGGKYYPDIHELVKEYNKTL